MQYLDALYGKVTIEEPFASFTRLPLVQRLRHVKLSNIDSMEMPGISNISRYEHVLGVGYLADLVCKKTNITNEDRIAVVSSAYMHDWAITAYGHLVEEALKYAGTGFEHETRLHDFASNEDDEDLGGASRQILHGRETGIKKWARDTVGISKEKKLILDITDYVHGKGKYGKLISSDIDIDNIDNVYRIAYHMGLDFDRNAPLSLANSIVGFDKNLNCPTFKQSAEPLLLDWINMRKEVYSLLMPSPTDFIGKLMVIYAVVSAFENDELAVSDWNLTDFQLLDRLTNSTNDKVSDAIKRWNTGEYWNATPLYWLSGKRPTHPELLRFSKEISAKLEKPYFAYGIKDKRTRKLNVFFEDGNSHTFGENSDQWLFGAGSSKKETISKAELNHITQMAQDFFGTHVIEEAKNPFDTENQLCLL